jgi:hypothetical protein
MEWRSMSVDGGTNDQHERNQLSAERSTETRSVMSTRENLCSNLLAPDRQLI